MIANSALLFGDINKRMINLQSSKRLIKTYDEIISSGMQQIHSDSLPIDHLIFKSKNIPKGKSESSAPYHFSRTLSKMVKIQFDEKNHPKHNNEIRLKRKMMTSSQKFYNRKKQHYSSYIKESHQKNNDDANQVFLTVGSHAIQKMDYTTTNFNQNIKYLEENLEIKRRLKDNFNISDIRSLIYNTSEDCAKVLILKKNEKTRFENTLHPHTERKTATMTKAAGKLERVLSSKPKTDRKKELSIEEFIPIRKNSVKKEPFIFGLSEKLANPQKNKDKLIMYHDFLWKINYSNGFYIKPSEPDALYKAFIGPGNNSNLIKSILRRRFWWTLVEKAENSNFVWTQLKVNSYFKEQKIAKTEIGALYPSQMIEQPDNLKSEPVANLQEGHEKIFNSTDLINWNRHMRKYRKSQRSVTQKTYKNRLQFLNCKEIVRLQSSQKLMMHNHLEQNYYIGNKKALFYNMKKYYDLQGLNVFDALPITYHITKGLDDGEFKQFLKNHSYFEEKKKKGEDVKNVWIMKPGQNSNRGNGITVCYHLDDIKLRLKAREKNSDGSLRTFIIQKYIQKPLLYKGRKFDIRHYMLLTSFNGIVKAYWFPEGYIRTSSSQFNLKKGTNLYIHLTNDAIQKHSEQYGKYQKGNKISYDKFQSYLNKNHENLESRNYFFNTILMQMKHLATQAVKSTFFTLDPNKRQHNFELLGMDFMIDDQLKPWLIEINTNPCLQLSSPLLAKIIPSFLEQAFRICIDPFFPPPEQCPANKKMFIGQNLLDENELQLIFDESIDGQSLRAMYNNNFGVDTKMGKIEQDDEVYQNDGAEQWTQKCQ